MRLSRRQFVTTSVFGGRGGADPRPGLRILEDVPADALPEVLDRLVRFFPRGERKEAGS